jgi:DNA-binding transcriptional MerR regulator
VTTELYHNRELNLSSALAAKPFFKIGEVAKFVGVKPHVIRYWETEFPSLTPKKNPSGQRIYVKADIEAIVEIKNLLYNERYTISGAKLMLARQKEGVSDMPPQLDLARSQALASLKEQVVELLMLLEQRSTL